MISRHQIALLALVAAGCAPSLFQRHLDAHRWTEAAEAFAADPRLAQNSQALYRAAVLHATPETPVYHPARARRLLEALIEHHPRGADREAALRLLPLIAALERTEALEQRRRTLETAVEQWRREIAGLQRSRDSLRARLAAAEADHDYLRRTIGALDAALRERDARLHSLQRELDRLKAVDLRPAPPPAVTPPRWREET